MKILSHRGHCADAPENTLDAFAAAISLGADGIETDVRLSADGLPVLFHDRLTPKGEPIPSLTREQLGRSVGYSIPTLQEALSRWPDTFWNLEIKVPEVAAPLLAVLDILKPPSILITSFLHQVIKECAQRGKYNCGVLVAHRPISLTSMVPYHADIKLGAVVWNYEIVDEDLLQESMEQQYRNYVYGAVTQQEHQRLRALPVDGIITDYLEMASNLT